MGKIHKLMKDGKVIHPATTTDAVVHPGTETCVSNLFNEINVSVVYPRGGVDGTDRYAFSDAIERIPDVLRSAGVKCSFLNASGEPETWEYRGGTFIAQSSWQKLHECLQDIYGESTQFPISQKGMLGILKSFYSGDSKHHYVRAGSLCQDGSVNDFLPNWRTIEKAEFISGAYVRSMTEIESPFVNYVTFDSNYNVVRYGRFTEEGVILKEAGERYISVCFYKDGDAYIGGSSFLASEAVSRAIYVAQAFPFEGYVNASGEFVPHILHVTTDYLACRSLKISLTWAIESLGASCVNFYDKDKKWLGGLSAAYARDGVAVDEIVPVPEEAFFVRVTARNDHPHECMVYGLRNMSLPLINRNVNFVGMSIWWYDGHQLAGGMGGGETAAGYQTLLKDTFSFLSDTGTSYCYSGNSLGATSDGDAMSICNKMPGWRPSANALWTLDTITNDFKRNIPVGTMADYTGNTGKMTYFGALRVFADKIDALSGDDKIVIVGNSLRRNNSGYTSSSKNTAGATLLHYEKALMEVALKNKWWFVDQFRLCGVTDDTIALTTIDGLHLNNLGYRLAVIPWVNVFNMFVSH